MRRRRLVRRSSQSDLNSPQHRIPYHRNSSPDATTVINMIAILKNFFILVKFLFQSSNTIRFLVTARRRSSEFHL
uniref:Ovule protein n=1 Tax=Heterorhabditis bacteriophora TaxID=37862 RepID=A0A1I7WG45_HETBA